MKLKAKVLGIGGMPAAEQAKYAFELDSIGNSRFAWDVANPDGKAIVNGDFLTATATFTRLPLNNTDFGMKKAKLNRDGEMVTEAKFEVFYPAYVSNFPRTTDVPNWFIYYKQNAGGGAFHYDIHDDLPAEVGGGTNWGAGEADIIIGKAAVDGKNRYHLTYIEGGHLKRRDWSEPIKYYASFVAVLEHEREHAIRQGAMGADDDPDGDHLTTQYEQNVSKTKPDSPISASPDFHDDEIYAGGPVEENAYKTADTSQDWANPGSNFGKLQP